VILEQSSRSRAGRRTRTTMVISRAWRIRQQRVAQFRVRRGRTQTLLAAAGLLMLVATSALAPFAFLPARRCAVDAIVAGTFHRLSSCSPLLRCAPFASQSASACDAQDLHR